MNSESCQLGFRIVGGCHNERRLVDWSAAFTGYANCDPKAEVESEGYLSAFVFGDAFRDHLTANRSTKGYAGPCGGDWLWLDIDAEGQLEHATAQTRRLCAGLVDRYGIDGDTLLVFFSGAKGFHVGLPMTIVGSPPSSVDFHKVAKCFALASAERSGVVVDTGVYDKVRAFRAPNSRHSKTGLRKRRLAFDELMGLSVDAIVRLAENPEAFDLPNSPQVSPQAATDWQAAAEAVKLEAAALTERRQSKTGATLNRKTREFITEGATAGDRHRLIFSAAANLREFGCPQSLAHALLTEPGLDSGLSPSDVRRQIDCGLAAKGG